MTCTETHFETLIFLSSISIKSILYWKYHKNYILCIIFFIKSFYCKYYYCKYLSCITFNQYYKICCLFPLLLFFLAITKSFRDQRPSIFYRKTSYKKKFFFYIRYISEMLLLWILSPLKALEDYHSFISK